MPTDHERFWQNKSFAFVGNSAKKPFPSLSYSELRRREHNTVYAVDPSRSEIEGEQAYPDLASLPEAVEAAVLEVPKEETRDWVERAADAGIRHLWIHMGRDTPEALALAQQRGLDVLTGSCAVMYVKEGFSFHSLHKWVNRLMGNY